MSLWHKFRHIQPAIVRHVVAKNYQPYERILKYVSAKQDVWITSQGEYLAWWLKRENANLKITVSNGKCQAYTSLENAVIQLDQETHLDPPVVDCQETDFSGEVRITIDSRVERKELLFELLKREGILNFRVGETGEFIILKEEVETLLEEIETKLRQRRLLYEEDISAIRQLVIDKLNARKLPLLRIWYHPRVNGITPRAVFSPRYDVDRAITNLPRIRALEIKYNASSSLYIRAFCPFYTDQDVKELASKSWCSEIALHGEFVTNGHKYGNEFKAAKAEKAHLEEITGRPVMGVGMHGGELAHNRSENTADVIQATGLLYDTTSPFYYYFPFKEFVNGRLSKSYTLCNGMSDVRVPANRDYGQVFYDQTIARMDKVYQQNGVFVLLLHPVYFGFFSYLFKPKNLFRLAKFFWQHFLVRKS